MYQASAKDKMYQASAKDIERIKGLLRKNENGNVKNTIENALIVLREDPILKGAIVENLLSDRINIIKDLGYKVWSI